MDLARLETLKEKLLLATEFHDVLAYFMDEFGEDPEFIALGERVRHTFLETAIGQISRQLFGENVHVIAHTLTRLRQQQFIHGGIVADGQFGTVLFFEDVQVGLLAIVMPKGGTQLVRFTGQRHTVN